MNYYTTNFLYYYVLYFIEKEGKTKNKKRRRFTLRLQDKIESTQIIPKKRGNRIEKERDGLQC